MFTHYDTVLTYFNIVHTHFDTVHSMFTHYDTVHTHFPYPEGTLSSKIPSSAIALANSEVCSVIDSKCHAFTIFQHVYILTVWHRAASCGF